MSLKVEQLMTRDVQTCRPSDALNEVARIMWERDCGCVPVVENDDGAARVVGMITDRDVCMAAYTKGRPLAELTAEGTMAREVRSCRQSDSLATALRILQKNQLHRLPVVDKNEHLVGMLSLADAAREAAREHPRSAKDLTDEQIGDVVAAIVAPRGPHTVAIAAA